MKERKKYFYCTFYEFLFIQLAIVQLFSLDMVHKDSQYGGMNIDYQMNEIWL